MKPAPRPPTVPPLPWPTIVGILVVSLFLWWGFHSGALVFRRDLTAPTASVPVSAASTSPTTRSTTTASKPSTDNHLTKAEVRRIAKQAAEEAVAEERRRVRESSSPCVATRTSTGVLIVPTPATPPLPAGDVMPPGEWPDAFKDEDWPDMFK